ncbi:hypothetical protein NVP1170O_047 [Vibrio phage 1.170.O._10N.261.52.C3]|nr:hypothetical protein NVP1170O_047 [Vibrio phage 1.170.O._10N.261.52.C3]
MSLVYFVATDGSTLVKLDCEESISVSRANQSTKSSIMTGASKSDGFVVGNRQVSIQGVVTYSKTPRQTGNPNPLEFIKHIDALINAHQRFTLYADTSYSKLLQDIEDCVITSFTHTVDKFEDTITVNLSFEEQFVTGAATTTYLPPQPSSGTSASLSENTDSGKTSKESVDEGSSLAYKAHLGSKDVLGVNEEGGN